MMVKEEEMKAIKLADCMSPLSFEKPTPRRLPKA
jgi:hypothetical protein